jgi:hypothetical protein
MVADEQFEKFSEETEQFLIKEMVPTLKNLPSFETWKQERGPAPLKRPPASR